MLYPTIFNLREKGMLNFQWIGWPGIIPKNEEEKELIINDFKKIISEATSIEKISRNWANLNKDREGYNKKGH